MQDEELSRQGRYPRRGAARQLYSRGPLGDQHCRLAVIGTRQVTTSMKTLALRAVQSFSKTCRGDGLTPSILSGLALGCDTAAHEAALRTGTHTVAVLPAGPQLITPASNRELAHQILASGSCLCSEHGSAVITKASFVLRDHLQAQLSAGTLVIATSIGGGSLHATRESLALGRPTGIVCPPASEASEEGYRGSAQIVSALRSRNSPALAEALGISRLKAQESLSSGALQLIEGPQSLQQFMSSVLASYRALRETKN